MKKYLYLVLPLALMSCQMSAKDAATLAANETRDIAATEHKIILDYCVPRYKAASTPTEIKEVDKLCLPAEAAYVSTKAAWGQVLTLLNAAKSGTVSIQELNDAARGLGETLAKLQHISGEMQ